MDDVPFCDHGKDFSNDASIENNHFSSSSLVSIIYFLVCSFT